MAPKMALLTEYGIRLPNLSENTWRLFSQPQGQWTTGVRHNRSFGRQYLPFLTLGIQHENGPIKSSPPNAPP